MPSLRHLALLLLDEHPRVTTDSVCICKLSTQAEDLRLQDQVKPLPLTTGLTMRMALRTESDEDLMQRVITFRDQHAFRGLVDRHKAMGMTLALRVLSDEMLAEEALQDAFLRVWRSAHTFTFNSSFATWFYRILYNAALTKRKSESKTEDHVELDEDSATGEDMIVSSNETTQVILECIERLPEAQRTVLTLYYLQELSLEEIGEVTSMPNGTIKTHLFRGREKLRNDVSLREYVNE